MSSKNVDKKEPPQSRRNFVLGALQKAGQVVILTNVTYVITHVVGKKGNTAGAK